MLLLSVLFGVALGAAPGDPCTRLCTHDGAAVCTGGSWTKPDGSCQAYLYRGHYTGNDYCYHTSATAAVCPAGGHAVRAMDVRRLLEAAQRPTTTSRPSRVLPPPIVVPVRSDDRLASFLWEYAEHEVEAVCASIAEIPEYIAGALDDAGLSRLPLNEFWTRVAGHRLLAMALRPSSCQRELVRAVASLMTPVAARVPEADSAEFGRSSGLRQFCIDNAAPLRVLMQQDPNAASIGAILTRFCPDQFDSRAERIAAMYEAIFRALYPQPPAVLISLVVNRTRAFSDALQLLNNATAASLSVLPGVRFLGESGTDAGGLRRDWFSMVTRLVFGANSTDPAGGLFAPKEGTEYIELDVSRPFNADTRGAYTAVGRLLAMSVTLRTPLGVTLPRMFFSRLLGRAATMADLASDDPLIHRGLVAVQEGGPAMVRAVMGLNDDDDCPTTEQYVADRLRELIPDAAEERLSAIREGFNSLIPIATIAPIISSDDLRSLVYGAPEISVDDLAAHTRYDGLTFTAASPQILWLWDWLRRSDNDMRRVFVRFVTGLSQLPVTGMAGLHPGLYITQSREGDLAPRSHTCSFGLDLPLYRNAAELEEWMEAAVASDGFGFA